MASVASLRPSIAIVCCSFASEIFLSVKLDFAFSMPELAFPIDLPISGVIANVSLDKSIN